MCVYIYIYSNLICLLFVNVRKNKVNEKTFKIKLYFDSYKSSMCMYMYKCVYTYIYIHTHTKCMLFVHVLSNFM